MWQSKKLIIVGVLVAIALVGGISGAVLADDNEDDSELQPRCGMLLDRVCEIYEENTGETIDQEALMEACTEARGEMHPEDMPNRGEWDPEAMQERLQNLVELGKITQEQADKKLEWCESMAEEGNGFGFKGRGGFPGMGGMRGSGRQCAPTE